LPTQPGDLSDYKRNSTVLPGRAFLFRLIFAPDAAGLYAIIQRVYGDIDKRLNKVLAGR
jgi:hypothetical protein